MFSSQPRQHNYRFYLVMITLVVVGILFAVNINNDSNGRGLFSGAITGFVSEENDTEKTEGNLEIELEEEFPDYFEEEEVVKYGREVDLTLSFDEVPTVEKEEARIKNMEIKFDDLSTKVNVNDDRLELNNLDEVNLRIKGFAGEFNLDAHGLSLAGTAKMLDINGISLSSKEEIKLSFHNLDYQYLNIEEIELKGLELPHGNGELTIGEKLSYSLEEDEVKFAYFNGMLIVNELNGTAINMQGVGRGVDISGSLMDLNLR